MVYLFLQEIWPFWLSAFCAHSQSASRGYNSDVKSLCSRRIRSYSKESCYDLQPSFDEFRLSDKNVGSGIVLLHISPMQLSFAIED